MILDLRRRSVDSMAQRYDGGRKNSLQSFAEACQGKVYVLYVLQIDTKWLVGNTI